MNAIYTIGHSTRPLEDFLALLAENGVQALVDVRRFPGSRRFPQHGSDALRRSLAAVGIDYATSPTWAAAGRRRAGRTIRPRPTRGGATRSFARMPTT